MHTRGGGSARCEQTVCFVQIQLAPPASHLHCFVGRERLIPKLIKKSLVFVKEKRDRSMTDK